MEINEIFTFPYDFGKGQKKICVNGSGMNAMFDIPYNFRLIVKFSTDMINNSREKNRVQLYKLLQANSCVVFSLTTALNKFCFHSLRNKKINLVLASLRF